MRNLKHLILLFVITLSSSGCEEDENVVATEELRLVKETLQIALTGLDEDIVIERSFEYNEDGYLIGVIRHGYSNDFLVSTTNFEYIYNENGVIVDAKSESTDYGIYNRTLVWNDDLQLTRINFPDEWYDDITYHGADSLHVSTLHVDKLVHMKGSKLDENKNPIVTMNYSDFGDGIDAVKRIACSYDYTKKHPYSLFKGSPNSTLTEYVKRTNPLIEYIEEDLYHGGTMTTNFIHRYNSQDLVISSTINYFNNGSELFKVESYSYEYEVVVEEE